MGIKTPYVDRDRFAVSVAGATEGASEGFKVEVDPEDLWSEVNHALINVVNEQGGVDFLNRDRFVLAVYNRLFEQGVKMDGIILAMAMVEQKLDQYSYYWEIAQASRKRTALVRPKRHDVSMPQLRAFREEVQRQVGVIRNDLRNLKRRRPVADTSLRLERAREVVSVEKLLDALGDNDKFDELVGFMESGESESADKLPLFDANTVPAPFRKALLVDLLTTTPVANLHTGVDDGSLLRIQMKAFDVSLEKAGMGIVETALEVESMTATTVLDLMEAIRRRAEGLLENGNGRRNRSGRFAKHVRGRDVSPSAKENQTLKSFCTREIIPLFDKFPGSRSLVESIVERFAPKNSRTVLLPDGSRSLTNAQRHFLYALMSVAPKQQILLRRGVLTALARMYGVNVDTLIAENDQLSSTTRVNGSRAHMPENLRDGLTSVDLLIERSAAAH